MNSQITKLIFRTANSFTALKKGTNTRPKTCVEEMTLFQCHSQTRVLIQILRTARMVSAQKLASMRTKVKNKLERRFLPQLWSYFLLPSQRKPSPMFRQNSTTQIASTTLLGNLDQAEKIHPHCLILTGSSSTYSRTVYFSCNEHIGIINGLISLQLYPR